jgi:serine/threonine-protein kinase ULK/ATG1
MGPEILSYKKYDAKADLWSVGAVLYEMVTGRPPFRAQNHLELLKKIQENNDVIRFPDEKSTALSPPTVGDDLKDLIRKLLKKDPVERISFEEFFVHPAILSADPSAPSPTPPASTYSSSASSSSFSTAHAHSPHQISTATPPRPISKQRYDQPTTYETPPFAQNPSSPSSSPYQDMRKLAYGSSPPTRQTQNKYYR